MTKLLWKIAFLLGRTGNKIKIIILAIVGYFKKTNIKITYVAPSRREQKRNKAFIDNLISKSLGCLAIIIMLYSCANPDDEPKPSAPAPTVDIDTLVKFTLYSKRVPYIWKREIKGAWVQDTIKTNNAVKYEVWDQLSYAQGVGYWVTMNTNGISTDSLHVMGAYKGRVTQMASLKGQSAAYVVLSAIGPK